MSMYEIITIFLSIVAIFVSICAGRKANAVQATVLEQQNKINQLYNSTQKNVEHLEQKNVNGDNNARL